MVSVRELDNNIFSVYPNPGSAIFTFDFSSFEKYDVTITDVQGRVVYSDINGYKKNNLLNGFDDIDYLQAMKSDIATFAEARDM